MSPFELEQWQDEQAELMLEDLREILKAEVDESLLYYKIGPMGFVIFDFPIESLFKTPYGQTIELHHSFPVIVGHEDGFQYPTRFQMLWYQLKEYFTKTS